MPDTSELRNDAEVLTGRRDWRSDVIGSLAGSSREERIQRLAESSLKMINTLDALKAERDELAAKLRVTLAVLAVEVPGITERPGYVDAKESLNNIEAGMNVKAPLPAAVVGLPENKV